MTKDEICVSLQKNIKLAVQLLSVNIAQSRYHYRYYLIRPPYTCNTSSSKYTGSPRSPTGPSTYLTIESTLFVCVSMVVNAKKLSSVPTHVYFTFHLEQKTQYPPSLGSRGSPYSLKINPLLACTVCWQINIYQYYVTQTSATMDLVMDHGSTGCFNHCRKCTNVFPKSTYVVSSSRCL